MSHIKSEECINRCYGRFGIVFSVHYVGMCSVFYIKIAGSQNSYAETDTNGFGLAAYGTNKNALIKRFICYCIIHLNSDYFDILIRIGSHFNVIHSSQLHMCNEFYVDNAESRDPFDENINR